MTKQQKNAEKITSVMYSAVRRFNDSIKLKDLESSVLVLITDLLHGIEFLVSVLLLRLRSYLHHCFTIHTTERKRLRKTYRQWHYYTGSVIVIRSLYLTTGSPAKTPTLITPTMSR